MSKKAKPIEIVVVDEDRQVIETAENKVLRLQLLLGQKVEELQAMEQQLLAAIQNARQEYNVTVSTVGQKLNLDVENRKWEFHRDIWTFRCVS